VAKLKLTSLSDLMPKKGSASQPEPVIEHASNQASKKASKHEISGPGDATTHFSVEQAREHASMQDRGLLNKPADPDATAEYQDGPRSAVSFRMTERLQDRLREYAHQTRRKKQDVLDQALHEFLRREGH